MLCSLQKEKIKASGNEVHRYTKCKHHVGRKAAWRTRHWGHSSSHLYLLILKATHRAKFQSTEQNILKKTIYEIFDFTGVVPWQSPLRPLQVSRSHQEGGGAKENNISRHSVWRAGLITQKGLRHVWDISDEGLATALSDSQSLASILEFPQATAVWNFVWSFENDRRLLTIILSFLIHFFTFMFLVSCVLFDLLFLLLAFIAHILSRIPAVLSL